MIRAALITVGLTLACAPAAFGHARLTGTSPERGATVAQQPAQVVFRFNEPVEGAFGAIRVFDSSAKRVDRGRAQHPDGRSSQLAVGLEPGLPDGSYTATYRLISADGHPVSGGLVFSIGEAGAGPAKSVDELLGASEAGPVTEWAFTAARAVQYAATALLLGGLAFLALCWAPLRAGPSAQHPFRARVRALLLWACAAGLLSGAAMIGLQGATANASSLWSALDPDVLSDVAGTRLGAVWALREGAWVLAGAAVLLGRLRLAPALVPAAFILIAPALSGHAHTQSPRGLLTALDIVHVGAMGLWLGGLALLLFALPAATRALAPQERTPLLAGALMRFSPLALGAVIALIGTGAGQAIVHMTAFDQLVDTAFGRAVAIKTLLLAALVVLGAVNRRRSLPALERAAAGGGAPGAAGRLLRRTLQAEVALLAAVLAVAGALVSYPPPVALAGGPYSATKKLGALLLEVTVDPASVGPNEMHLYLLRASDGAPSDAAKEVRATFSLPSKEIGPLPASLRKAGPGHYVADTLDLGPAGDWELEIAVRVSEFDELRKTLEVTVE